MAGGGAVAAAAEEQNPGMTTLAVADATRIGTDWWADSSGSIVATITVPVSSPTALGGASGCRSFLLWDLGEICGVQSALTLADLAGVTMEMNGFILPSGTGQKILLPFGVVFSSSAIGSVAFATAKSNWCPAQFGILTEVAATAGYGASANNAAPAAYGASEVNTARLHHNLNVIPTGSTYGLQSAGIQVRATTAISGWQSSIANTNLSGALKAYAFVGADLGRTTGSSAAPSFALKIGVNRRTAPS